MSRGFDFGFSFEDEDFMTAPVKEKLDQTLEVNKALEYDAQEYANRLDTVMEMIMPLLNNLMKDPDKIIIKWPDRASKVADFKKQLLEAAGMDK